MKSNENVKTLSGYFDYSERRRPSLGAFSLRSHINLP